MLLLVDFLNVAYRSFFAIRTLTNSKGAPTNAVYGFVQSVRRWLEECKPTHLAIVFDAETPRRRLDLLPQYKANRPPTPPALPPQLETLTRLFPLLGWPTALDPLEEADDLAAAMALAAAREGHDVRIASNDKDFFQIVGPRIKVLRSTPKETVLADDQWVRQRWGIEPSQVADFLALQGDSADNIPGVKGVGEKTAAELVRRFGSIEKLLAALDQVERPGLRAALEAGREDLGRNLKLIRLNLVEKLPPLAELRLQPVQREPLCAMLAELEFRSLLARYTKTDEEPPSESRQGLLF